MIYGLMVVPVVLALRYSSSISFSFSVIIEKLIFREWCTLLYTISSFFISIFSFSSFISFFSFFTCFSCCDPISFSKIAYSTQENEVRPNFSMLKAVRKNDIKYWLMSYFWIFSFMWCFCRFALCAIILLKYYRKSSIFVRMRIVQVQPHRITRYRTVTYYHPGTISNKQHFILSFKDEVILTAEESATT